MDSAEQVVFVLQLVLTLGPLAVYFLGLGLVNSQAQPCLVGARADFVVLSVALIPMFLGPLVALTRYGWWWPAAAVLACVSALFFFLLPRRDGDWVIYNTGAEQCRRLLARACRQRGWSVQGDQQRIEIPEAGLVVTISPLPWLRNVTLGIGRAGPSDASDRAEGALIESLSREIRREAMLPSPAGASLVIIGACLLMVPMWYLAQNMDMIVNVVRHILFA